jgi:tRNA nucleotidyltransferase (CCA-adding enzyme)
MPEIINLSQKIKAHLPVPLVNFMRSAGETAVNRGQNLYLVGGVVRDLLLGETNFDLDLVIEGDAISLAQQLIQITGGKLITHHRFKTAKIQLDNWSIDLTSARSEIYSRPGALPSIKPSSIDSDLYRRDFTINAMAIELNPSRYGELIDLYQGRDDLKHKLIRVLHEKSFIYDATRIWRSIRYEQRLDFKIEPATLGFLNRDISMLDTISKDRIRNELELVFREECPEKVLNRAEELTVLSKIHPGLKGNGWLAKKFEEARQLNTKNLPPLRLYLALITYPLTGEENEQLISRLKLTKSLVRILRDTNQIKTEIRTLSDPKLNPSSIFFILHGYSVSAVIANSIACDSLIARKHIQLFINKLRSIKPTLTGNDLQKMGVTSGPRIKEVLNLLHKARLDGMVDNKRDEELLIKKSLI